jgi:glutathione S-transferase
MLTLYYSPGACSLAPHIALEEAGASFEAKPISLKRGDQRKPDYLAINPKGKVPALVIDGRPLTENPAILTYIARRFPEKKLLPADSIDGEVRALSLLAWASSTIHPTLGRFFGPQRLCDLPGSEESVLRLAREANAANFALVDKALAGKDYALGAFSVVDAYLFVFFRWAGFLKIDMTPFPNYAAHGARIGKRPAVQRVLAREQEAQEQLEKRA